MMRRLVLAVALAACHRPGHTVASGTGLLVGGYLITTDDSTPGAVPIGTTVAVVGTLVLLGGVLQRYMLDTTW